MFHLMPYRELPADFERRYNSAHVDPVWFDVADADKVDILRAYLKRWKFEVGVFFAGVGPESSDDEVRAIAARHPAFEVLPADE